MMVDERETCKVADFGLLREIPKDNTIYLAMTEMPWPIRWMASESLIQRIFSSLRRVELWCTAMGDVLSESTAFR